MLKNYLKSTLRNLVRHSLISAINITGLSIGVAGCIIAAIFIRNEITYDKHHQDVEDIYRITSKYKTFTFSSTPYILSETIESSYQDVYSQLRIATAGKRTIRVGTELYTESVLLTDPNYFQFFGSELKEGAESKVLSNLQSLVVSEEMASKYFAGHALGKALEIELFGQWSRFIISGVASKPPTNTSLYFDFLIPLENNYLAERAENKNKWMNYNVTSFIKTKDQQALNDDLPNFISDYMGEAIRADGNKLEQFGFVLNPMLRQHLSDQDSGNGLKAGASSNNYLYIFSGVSVLILLIACFNFINLSTAQNSGRLKEIAVRKVSGAYRWQLAQQFLFEAFGTAVVSVVIALGLAELVMVGYPEVMGAQLSLSTVSSQLWFWLSIIGFTTVLGILTGIYPSILLSRLKIVDAFSSKLKVGGANLMTRIMITVQFVMASLLIISSNVMNRQQRLFMDSNLGYNYENIIVIPTQVERREFQKADQIVAHFKNRVGHSPGFVNVASVSNSFTRSTSTYMRTNSDGEDIAVFEYRVDDDYLPTLGIEIKAGRNFSGLADQENSIIVNQAYVDAFALSNPVGTALEEGIAGIESPRIIGVVEDYNFQSLKAEVQPMFLYTSSQIQEMDYILVKVTADQISKKIELLEDSWHELALNKPFDFRFLEEDIQTQYENDEMWRGAVNHATGIATFLSCLGLLGMVTFNVKTRRREIGIRKVFGASIPQLIMRLASKYAWLILTAFVISVPLAHKLLTEWLNAFENKINLGVGSYLFPLILLSATASVAILYHLIKASLENPIHALKEE